ILPQTGILFYWLLVLKTQTILTASTLGYIMLVYHFIGMLKQLNATANTAINYSFNAYPQK
ncbi:unnamed protein product, partial [Ceratitis capitata]